MEYLKQILFCIMVLVTGFFLKYVYSVRGSQSHIQYIVPGHESILQTLIREKTAADDPRLIQVLRAHMLDPPSHKQRKQSYPLFRTPQAGAVDKILKNKRNGFFVECGALDGEQSSNTIFLEQKRRWTGLLVEVDPSWYQQLRGKNRRSYSINACMSPHNYPAVMDFRESSSARGTITASKRNWSTSHIVYCFYTMLLALNRTHIDYFSLDVEGLELDVLQTIPFDKVDISVFTVEYIHVKAGKSALTKFMESKGYITHSQIDVRGGVNGFYARDLVFVKQNSTNT